jgi:hypothetical protein
MVGGNQFTHVHVRIRSLCMPLLAVLEGTTYRSPVEVEQWIEDLKQDWAAFGAKPEHFHDLGDAGRIAGPGPARRGTAGFPAGGLAHPGLGGKGQQAAVVH